MRSRLLMMFALVGLSALLFAAQASAVIMVLVPLSDVIDKEQHIFIAKVQEILPDKPAMVLVADEALKGKTPFERMPVNLTGDGESKKGKHTEVLLDRIEKDTPIMVITTKRGGKYIAYGFTNGTWFQMEGRIDKQDDKEIVRWSFLHCEPYLRRTFKGTTEELKQIVGDSVGKKKAPPAPNEKEPAGFGPAIKKKTSLEFPLAATRRSEESRSSLETLRGAAKQHSTFPVLGVIQLPFLGLIAALAALFPTVFGGLALFMKRWVALLSTSGMVSLFVTLPMLAPGWSAKQWLYSPSGEWLTCAILFSIGALWSLRRYRRSLETGTSEIMQPRKADRFFLTILFGAGAGVLLIAFGLQLQVWTNEYWRWALAGTSAVGAGSWYLIVSHLRNRTDGPPLRIAPETVMLWVLAGSCIAYGSWEAGRYSQRGQGLAQGTGGVGQPTLNSEPIWKFEAPGGGAVVNTCATPERVYVAVMMVEGLTGRFGRIYALDPNTGAKLWQFDNDYETDSDKGMKPAFSAPVFADGRLYFGEGLHTDNDSRLFCLNAETGEKLWEYKTESHTESTPFVADGRVVIGAGYHGLHCVDAVTGQQLWRYPATGSAADRAMHVDCNPVIANGLVYAGSGYKPEYVKEGKVNKVYCIDVKTGKKKWSQMVEDSVYGSPLVHNGRVFFGTGNSTYSESFPSKRPGVLCYDAETGAEIWYRQLPESVMARPAADKFQLFVGCLDGKAYALDLRSGQINWSLDMGGAILAGPVVQTDAEGVANTVYFASKFGMIKAASPYSGKIFWSASLSYWTQQPVEDLSATPTFLRFDDENDTRRRFFIGFGQGRANSTVPRLLCIEDKVKTK